MDQQTSSLSFQTRVGLWVTECFGTRTALDVRERALRFCEEALKVVQSFGLTAADAHRMVDYVFGRPIGETTQEIGGAMVTLAALGYATNIDVFAAGDLEATRIETCIPQILAKQQLKAESGGITSSIADEKVCRKIPNA
jgi:hypothetical protein